MSLFGARRVFAPISAISPKTVLLDNQDWPDNQGAKTHTKPIAVGSYAQVSNSSEFDYVSQFAAGVLHIPEGSGNWAGFELIPSELLGGAFRIAWRNSIVNTSNQSNVFQGVQFSRYNGQASPTNNRIFARLQLAPNGTSLVMRIQIEDDSVAVVDQSLPLVVGTTYECVFECRWGPTLVQAAISTDGGGTFTTYNAPGTYSDLVERYFIRGTYFATTYGRMHIGGSNPDNNLYIDNQLSEI